MSDQATPLPCPWCRKEPSLLQARGAVRAAVECLNAKCQAMPSVFGDTEAAAIARWNTRAQPPAVAELVAAARAMPCFACGERVGEGACRCVTSATLRAALSAFPTTDAATRREGC